CWHNDSRTWRQSLDYETDLSVRPGNRPGTALITPVWAHRRTVRCKKTRNRGSRALCGRWRERVGGGLQVTLPATLGFLRKTLGGAGCALEDLAELLDHVAPARC